MSLYGGISFQKDKPDAAGSSSAVVSAGNPVEPTAAATPSTPAVAAVSTSNWSSALKFNPVVRRPVKRGPATSTIPLAFRNSNTEETAVMGTSRTRIVGPAKSSPFVADAGPSSAPAPPPPPPPPSSAPPITASAPSMHAHIPATAPSAVGDRVLPKAPSMTLDEEDVDGTASKGKGKQPASSSSAAGNRSGAGGAGGRGRKGGHRDDPAMAYTDVTYDPARPCDYSMYKAHVKAVRTQRRIDREEELKRARRSASGSSSYTGSSDEDDGDAEQDQQAAQKKARFVPPASYDNVPAPSTSSAYSAPPPSVAVPMKMDESGEEAYLRRLAMSSSSTIAHASAPPRAARDMTQQPPPTPRYPAPAALTTPSAAPFLPPPSFFPTSTAASTYSAPSSVPSPVLPPPPSPAPTSSPSTLNSTAVPVALSEAAAKARDIALRFSKLAGMQPPAPVVVPIEQDDRPFAQRMMASYGWKEGEGLGATNSGRLDALSVARPVSNSQNYKGKQKETNEMTSSTGMAKGRGAIIDTSRESRLATEQLKYGSPSRIVLLNNLCAAQEVDDELSDEVVGEANKFGVAERAVVYVVPGERREEEAVRIFLVMSGLAGGWNAVKTFENRHFGGRVVKARFYDEAAFNAKEYRL